MIYGSPLSRSGCHYYLWLGSFRHPWCDPLDALFTFFISPVSSLDGWTELFVKATPLVLIAVGLSFGFQANVWNIGAEGQLTIGALAGGGLALLFFEAESVLLLPAMMIAGVLGGNGLGCNTGFLEDAIILTKFLRA